MHKIWVLCWGAGAVCEGYGSQDYTDRAHGTRDKMGHGCSPWGHAGCFILVTWEASFVHTEIIYAAEGSVLSSITEGWGLAHKPKGTGRSGPWKRRIGSDPRAVSLCKRGIYVHPEGVSKFRHACSGQMYSNALSWGLAMCVHVNLDRHKTSQKKMCLKMHLLQMCGQGGHATRFLGYIVVTW